jgi:hypothetical protein
MTPLLLARTVRLESIDPQSRGVIRLDLTPTNVAAVTPGNAVGSFVVTENQGIATDVCANFCSHVYHFTDLESAAAYVATDPRRYVVELGKLREIAEDLFSAVWS